MYWTEDGTDGFAMTLSSNGTLNTSARGATTPALATWVHAGFVSNDIDMRVYVNGSLDSNGGFNPVAYTTGIFNGSTLPYVGSRPNISSNADGLVDDLALFDRELTSVEIAEIDDFGVDGSNDVVSARRIIMISDSRNSTLTRYLYKRLGIDYKPEIMMCKYKGQQRAVIFVKDEGMTLN